MLAKLKDAGEQEMIRKSKELKRGYEMEKGLLATDMEREILREKVRIAAEERLRSANELEKQKKMLLGDPGNWEVGNLTCWMSHINYFQVFFFYHSFFQHVQNVIVHKMTRTYGEETNAPGPTA
jgi:hypothetical protein